MITRIKVKNFKSLVDFEITGLTHFSCFIGLNGAGKTTLLQFFDFLRALLSGRVQEWFEHKLNPASIVPFGSTKRLVEFEIEIKSLDGLKTWIWEVRFNISEKRCVHEVVRFMDKGKKKTIVFFDGKILTVGGETYPLPPGFNQTGAICSLFNPLPEYLSELADTRIFEVLDPAAIAMANQVRSGQKAREIQANGNGLVGFVSQLTPEKQEELFEKLKEFYPSLKSYKIKKLQYGIRKLLFNEFGNSYFEASNLSYGTLRLLVIISQLYSEVKCLVFDEIENGINQELMGKLLELLQSFKNKQVMVTTHSALVLNYLSDEAAKQSVILLFKDAKGGTKAVKFFDIDGMAQKLDVLGPGEVMGDTNLEELSKSLANSQAYGGID